MKTTTLKTRVTIAPYYDTAATKDNFEHFRQMAEKPFLNNAERILSAIGITPSRILTNIGGYSFHDCPKKMIHELSYTFEFESVEETKTNLFACLLADLGFEQQEVAMSTINQDSTDKANAIEFSIRTEKKHLFQTLQELETNNYTYHFDNKTISIMSPSNKGYISKRKSLIAKNLRCSQKDVNAKPVRTTFLDYHCRMNIYKNWLNSRDFSIPVHYQDRLFQLIKEACRLIDIQLAEIKAAS